MQLYFVGARPADRLRLHSSKILPEPHYTSSARTRWTGRAGWCWPGWRWRSCSRRSTPGCPGRRCWRRSRRTSSAPRGPRACPNRTVYGRHALRAAITPIVTIAGLDVGAALGGTVITETTFGIQGLGRTAVDAVRAGDLSDDHGDRPDLRGLHRRGQHRGRPALRGHRPARAARLARSTAIPKGMAKSVDHCYTFRKFPSHHRHGSGY